MANATAICDSYRIDLLNGIHAFGTTVARAGTGADTFNLALYLTTASLGSGTTAYSSTNELAASGNYTAGGKAISAWNAPAQASHIAYTTPTATVTWTSLTSSGSFDGVLLYNATNSNKAVQAWNIGTQSITASDFSLTMPTNDGSTGLVRIA